MIMISQDESLHGGVVIRDHIESSDDVSNESDCGTINSEETEINDDGSRKRAKRGEGNRKASTNRYRFYI